MIDGSIPKEFTYNFEKGGKHYGMIAQDARKLLDELGEKDSKLEIGRGVNDVRSINYEEYIPHLINYVKELRSEIEALKKALKED